MGSDGRYVFRSCVPDGTIDIGNVKQGEALSRSYTFAVNEFAPSDIQSLLDSGALDPRNIVRGVDGELFDGDGNFLAQVPEWNAQMTPKTTEYQPAASMISWKLQQGYSVALTLTETVVQDIILLKKALDSVMSRQGGALNFQGVIRSRA